MKNFDDPWFEQVGLGALPPDTKALFRAHLATELEQRVGRDLVERLTKEEFDELESLLAQDDDLKTARWLSKHIPQREAIIADFVERITDEVEARAAEILEAG